MGYTAAEERIALRLLLVHMRIEMISREIGEALDVLHRDLTLPGMESVADLELMKRDAERVSLGRRLARALHPTARDGGDGRRRALQGGALHVVQYSADAAHLLTAASAAGAAVNQMRH